MLVSGVIVLPVSVGIVHPVFDSTEVFSGVTSEVVVPEEEVSEGVFSGDGDVVLDDELVGEAGDETGVPPSPRTMIAIQSKFVSAVTGDSVSIVNPVTILSVTRYVTNASAVTVTRGISLYGCEKSTRTLRSPALMVAVPAISLSENVTRSSNMTVERNTTDFINVTISVNVASTRTRSNDTNENAVSIHEDEVPDDVVPEL